MTFSAFVRSRLTELGCGQKELAQAVEVTDSYISQLLTRRKAPPDRERTDIYPKMEAFLRLEPGQLGQLAEIERLEEVQRRLGQAAAPLLGQFRDLVLSKCVADNREEVRAVFDRQAFGTLERLVTAKLLETAQRVARRELDGENWLRLAAILGDRSREAMRVVVLEFLDADVFQVSRESCVAFLEPLVASWQIDLDSLALEITLNERLVTDAHRSYRFIEGEPSRSSEEPPGLAAFLDDPELATDVTAEEIRCLRSHRFAGAQPNKLYYYRALQNLRDPLHRA